MGQSTPREAAVRRPRTAGKMTMDPGSLLVPRAHRPRWRFALRADGRLRACVRAHLRWQRAPRGRPERNREPAAGGFRSVRIIAAAIHENHFEIRDLSSEIVAANHE